MSKGYKTKKTMADDFLSKNKGQNIRYKKRIQEETEVSKELKDYLKKDVPTNVK